MPKRILIVLGHPRSDSFCGALAEAYAEGARAGGSEVRAISLGSLPFDPILRDGYAKIQPLEPDLVAAQASIRWAEHLVFVYPLWWGAMPALLKGFIDRVFLPGFAFKFRDGSVFWDRLLAGRSAHLLVTMDTPPWYRVLSDGSPDVDPRGIPAGRVGFGSLHRVHGSWDAASPRLLAIRAPRGSLVFGDPSARTPRWISGMPGHKQMKHTILGFSGVKPVKVSSFGPVKSSTPAQREKWLAQARGFGRGV